MVNRQLSDEQLLALYQKADVAAFDEFFRRYRNILYNYLLAVLGNTSDADEAVQEVFIKIHRSIHHYDPTKKAAPWIFTIARHVAFDTLRHRKRLAEVALSSPTIGHVDERMALEARETLAFLLKDLSEDDASLILNRFLDSGDLTSDGSAAETKAATRRKRLSRLLAKIRAKSLEL